jgi:hypothetical protein
MVSLINFLIRWKIISRNHKRLGKIYFLSFFTIPLLFLLGIGSAYLYDQNHQEQLLYLFYFFIVSGVAFVVLVAIIEIYVFLAWIKRNIF